MSHFIIFVVAFGVFFFSWAETPPHWGAEPKGEEVLHEKVYKEVLAPVPYKSRKDTREENLEDGLDTLDESDVETDEEDAAPELEEDHSEDGFLKDLDEELESDPDISGDEEVDAPEESEDSPEEESEEEGLDALDEDLSQDPNLDEQKAPEAASEGAPEDDEA